MFEDGQTLKRDKLKNDQGETWKKDKSETGKVKKDNSGKTRAFVSKGFK